MFRHVLISAAGSLLIVGGSLLALTMASASPTTATQPAGADGLPVTDLPGMTVYPSPPAQSAAHARRTGNRATAIDHPLMNNLVQAAATRAIGSHLRMPYYSFGSASGTAHAQTRKD